MWHMICDSDSDEELVDKFCRSLSLLCRTSLLIVNGFERHSKLCWGGDGRWGGGSHAR